MILVATCMFGLEKQLGEEIDALGLKRVHPMDGRVTFAGDEEAVAFAILANEALFGICNNAPSATGAKHGVVMGRINL